MPHKLRLSSKITRYLKIVIFLFLVSIVVIHIWYHPQTIRPLPANSPAPLSFFEIQKIMSTLPAQADTFEKGWNCLKGKGHLDNRNSKAFPWRYAHMQSSEAGSTVTDPLNTRNHCMQFQWLRGKGMEYDARNTQKKSHLYGDFANHCRTKELWHFNIYFPSQTMKLDTEPEIIIQWHGHPDIFEASRPPPLALDNKNDRLTLSWRYDTRFYTPPVYSNWDIKTFDMGPTPKDKWVNFVFKIHWNPEGNGSLSVWQNKKLKAHYSPIAIGFNDNSGTYIGFGMYKFTNKSKHPKRLILFDDVKQWTISMP